jgi:2'-deoxynucleoside 5'-phosphate N-hydrolase
MKIFFNASLSGRKEFNENYEVVIAELNRLGYKLESPIQSGRTIADRQHESAVDAAKYYRKLIQSIAGADICVFEVSFPSTGIGHEISVAMDMNKPVIALHTIGKQPYVLEAMQSDKLQVIGYDLEELPKVLRYALDFATEQQDTRFNFFISPNIGHYLDWVSKRKRLPRAVYLRRLIEEDMKNNKEYSKE